MLRGKHQHGSSNSSAKLSDDQVFQIKCIWSLRGEAYETSPKIIETIAKKFGVSVGCIREIVYKVRWKHIKGPEEHASNIQ